MSQKIWLKRVLIPFIVIETFFTIINIAAAAIVIVAASRLTDDEFNDNYVPSVYNNAEVTNADFQRAKTEVIAIAGVLLAISFISVLFDVIAVTLWARHRLMPATLVGFNATKTFFWLVFMILGIFRLSVGFFWSIVLLACALGQLIYASIILHRFRRGNMASRGLYTPAVGGSYAASQTLAPASVQNPFRDASASQESMRHHDGPKFAPGAATEYYGPSAPAPMGAYEMQNAQTGYGGSHNV